jgi:hypothetical protein
MASRVFGDAVDRPLTAGGELHHQEIRPAVGGQELDGLLEAHRYGSRSLVQKLVRAVDGGVENPEPP